MVPVMDSGLDAVLIGAHHCLYMPMPWNHPWPVFDLDSLL